MSDAVQSGASLASGGGSRRSTALLPTGTFAGFVVAGLAAIVVAWISLQSAQSRSALVRGLTASQQTIDQLQTLVSTLKDAETGQRGFLLTGDERYLEPFADARVRYSSELERLRVRLGQSSPERFNDIAQATAAKFEELEATVALRRAGRAEEALERIRSDRGKVLMDRIRAVSQEIETDTRARTETRRAEWEAEARAQGLVTWGGTGLLLALILLAAAMASRDYRARERNAWLSAGESTLASRLQGVNTQAGLGEAMLAFLAEQLDAKVGAAYALGDDGLYHRVAGYALEGTPAGSVARAGEGLLGEAARQGRAIRVTDLPDGYLPLSSAVGRGPPRELLVAPAAADGEVVGVLEAGFVRSVDSADLELVDRVAETLAVAMRSARERERREQLLAETQRQAAELQAQQEELRVANEELEEQGNALRESQARLESQQSELEQSNVRLEEQTQRLERQKRELQRAQEAMAENARALERTSRYKSEFLANMSHELRTPLNSSLILAKLLGDNAKGNLDDEQVRFARTIHDSNNDLLVLINDILDLSKIEAGQVDVVAEPVALDQVLESMRRTFSPVASTKKIGLAIERASDAPEQVVTDRQRVEQVLKNLLSNAFKFTEKGEVALLVTAGREGGVAFKVRDTGIGIPAQQQDVIWEAFRQADGTTSRKYGGTGLGLSISRELAHLLGGTIRLESAPGLGSTFTFEIPATWSPQARQDAAAPREASPASAGSANPGSAATGRIPAATAVPAGAPSAPAAHIADDRSDRHRPERLILVVEDDEKFARVLYDLAHELDFDCVHATTAAEGLELARRLQPSGILLDVGLPDDSGLAMLERIKRDPAVRHIPVHMMSVEDHVQAALGMGAVGYALKPVAREDLVKAIGRLESKLERRVARVLVVEDDAAMREGIVALLRGEAVEIDAVGTVGDAIARLEAQPYDCLVTDLQLPDASGYELMERLSAGAGHPYLPVIVYTGRALTRDEEVRLRRYSRSIIIKGARSPERLLDEVTLFLHRVESSLPEEKRDILRRVRQRDEIFEGRRILLAEDDVRNIFALSRVLEPLGAHVDIARNGREAVDRVRKGDIDLVLMDIMMPVMDGLEAIREIRSRPEGDRLPIIAITAKAMADDRRQCLEAGANDYIAKPIDVDKLVSLCRVWIPK